MEVEYIPIGYLTQAPNGAIVEYGGILLKVIHGSVDVCTDCVLCMERQDDYDYSFCEESNCITSSRIQKFEFVEDSQLHIMGTKKLYVTHE